MEYPLFMQEIQDDGVAHIALTRPAKHNAINAELVAELTSAFHGLASDSRVRCLVLTGEGPSFCAGGDLSWMQSVARAEPDANFADAHALGALLTTLNALPLPTMALIHGAAIGAGFGMAACCDIVIADTTAKFGLPETRIGLVPGVIAPFVLRAIGERAMRRYSLSGEKFGPEEASRLGLVHEVVGEGALEGRGREILDAILRGAPGSQRESKAQIHDLADGMCLADSVNDGAARIALRRASSEGREGMSAFLEKRRPDWTPQR